MQEVGALLPIRFVQLAVAWLIIVNLLAFCAFGWDKARARSGGRRVREDTLTSYVLFGGLAGALAGRAVFRHKTRKRSFTNKLWGAAVANLLLVGGGWYLLSDTSLPRALPDMPFLRSAEEQARLDRVMASVTYSGCNEVRAAGKAPLHYGEPGYRTTMDGDGDGIACEPQPF